LQYFLQTKHIETILQDIAFDFFLCIFVKLFALIILIISLVYKLIHILYKEKYIYYIINRFRVETESQSDSFELN